jgi:uncharacterized membrane protein YkvA (DUF1232 family)
VKIDHKALNAAMAEAERTAADRARATALLADAMRKAEHQEGRLRRIWGELHALFRLVRAWLKGTYREVPWKTIVLVLAALVYFLNPLDMIPDAMLGIGYLDDATVIAWVLRSVKRDLERFAAWEAAHDAAPATKV